MAIFGKTLVIIGIPLLAIWIEYTPATHNKMGANVSDSAVTIYHNPRCSKSRQTLQILEDQGYTPEIILYLKTPPTTETLSGITRQLGITPRDLLRKGELEYQENGLQDRTLTDQHLLEVMVAYPKLIERPIVLANGKARIGRPPECVLEIL